MRVWDISPGYLNRQSLLGEHNEIHGLFTVITQGRAGFARHPETLRWASHLPGLALRHQMVVSEMTLRGYAHRSPLAWGPDPDWPSAWVTEPWEQYGLLAERYATRGAGRLALPADAAELWSAHRLSVEARGVASLALLNGAAEMSCAALARATVSVLRTPPDPAAAQRALEALLSMGTRGKDDPRPAGDTFEDQLRWLCEQAVVGAVPHAHATTLLADLHAWVALRHHAVKEASQ